MFQHNGYSDLRIIIGGKSDKNTVHIAAADLDTHYQLKIGSNEYNYSVLNYVQKLLSSSQNEAAKELGKATVRYNEAANSYFP